jgi:hypothetical protein
MVLDLASVDGGIIFLRLRGLIVVEVVFIPGLADFTNCSYAGYFLRLLISAHKRLK